MLKLHQNANVILLTYILKAPVSILYYILVFTTMVSAEVRHVSLSPSDFCVLLYEKLPVLSFHNYKQ